jgi:hypothetical protein
MIFTIFRDEDTENAIALVPKKTKDGQEQLDDDDYDPHVKTYHYDFLNILN